MKLSLEDALRRVDLGVGYEKLGKNEGFFSGRDVLAYSESEGWQVRHLNIFQLFLRDWLGFYKETHLKTIVAKLKAELSVDPQLLNRIGDLFKRKYPNELFDIKAEAIPDQVPIEVPKVPLAEKSVKECLAEVAARDELKGNTQIQGRLFVLRKIIEKRNSLSKELTEQLKNLGAKSPTLADELEEINQLLQLDTAKIDAFHAAHSRRELCARVFSENRKAWEEGVKEYNEAMASLGAQLHRYAGRYLDFDEATGKFTERKRAPTDWMRSNEEVNNLRKLLKLPHLKKLVHAAFGDPESNVDSKIVLEYLSKPEHLSQHPEKVLEAVVDLKKPIQDRLDDLERNKRYLEELLVRSPSPKFAFTQADREALRNSIESVPAFSERIQKKKALMNAFIDALDNEEEAVKRAKQCNDGDCFTNLPSESGVANVEKAVRDVLALRPAREAYQKQEQELEAVKREIECVAAYLS